MPLSFKVPKSVIYAHPEFITKHNLTEQTVVMDQGFTVYENVKLTSYFRPVNHCCVNVIQQLP